MGNILCDLDPKVKVTGKRVGIGDGIPSTAALVRFRFTQVNRMCRSRRVLATGGKQTEYGWTGSVFIHFYFL